MNFIRMTSLAATAAALSLAATPAYAVGPSDRNATATARHQFEYAAGLELEAAPKVTLLVDVIGGQIFGGGKLGMATVTSGVTSYQALVALPEGLRKVDLVPGLKVNLKGKLVLALNALVGSMVGLERSVLPLIGKNEFNLSSSAAILAFVVAFGAAKAITNLLAGFIDHCSDRRA